MGTKLVWIFRFLVTNPFVCFLSPCVSMLLPRSKDFDVGKFSLDLVSWIVAQLGLNVNRHDAIQYSHWLSNLIQFSKSI
jgi:hypothetical protein